MGRMDKIITGPPCPKCGSTCFSRCLFSTVYRCVECGWVGNHSEAGEHSRAVWSGKNRPYDRLLMLKQLHDENPHWNKSDLLEFSGEDEYAVDKYWKLRDAMNRVFVRAD